MDLSAEARNGTWTLRVNDNASYDAVVRPAGGLGGLERGNPVVPRRGDA